MPGAAARVRHKPAAPKRHDRARTDGYKEATKCSCRSSTDVVRAKGLPNAPHRASCRLPEAPPRARCRGGRGGGHKSGTRRIVVATAAPPRAEIDRKIDPEVQPIGKE